MRNNFLSFFKLLFEHDDCKWSMVDVTQSCREEKIRKTSGEN